VTLVNNRWEGGVFIETRWGNNSNCDANALLYKAKVEYGHHVDIALNTDIGHSTLCWRLLPNPETGETPTPDWNETTPSTGNETWEL
jgi:hypothetical protein